MLGARGERGRMKNKYTIDDAIGQCEAMAAALERECHNPDSNWRKYASIAAEKRQMAEWLRELKKFRATEKEVYMNSYKEGYADGYADGFEEKNADDEGGESE